MKFVGPLSKVHDVSHLRGTQAQTGDPSENLMLRLPNMCLVRSRVSP